MTSKAKKDIVRKFLWTIVLYSCHEIAAIFGSFLIFFAITKLLHSNLFSLYLINIFGVIWLIASTSVGLILVFIDSFRYFFQKTVFRPSPIIPSLVHGLASILIELSISTFILAVLLRFYSLSFSRVILAVIFVILGFEITRRFSRAISGFYSAFSKIKILVKYIKEELGRSWSFLAYWAITLVFAFFSYKALSQGFISPFDNQPETARELFSNVLTITTAILAIFFAGATLIVQLIVGVYSFKFVAVLFRNSIFVSSFLIYLLIDVIHLVFLRIGWNSNLANFSLISSFYIIISLAILAGHFADWVQVPYVIEVVTKDIQKYMGRFKKPKIKTNRHYSQRGTPSLKYQVRSYFLAAFLGEDYKDPYLEELASHRFPTHIQKKIIEDTRPLLTACLKAINEDRREVVLACLSGVNEITKTYINKFDDLIFTTDDFFMFLYDQLSVVYEAAIESKNQQFTLDIVKTVIEIGKNCLVLTKDTRENNHIFIWIEFLRESIIKSLHLQRTGAQMTACAGIVDIGKSLIEQNAYSTVLHVIVVALHKIGQAVASIKHMWTAAIAVRATSGLVELLAVYMIETWRSDLGNQFFVDDVCKKLFNILDLAYKNQGNDYLTLTSISNSIVGRNSGLNLTGIVSIVLMHWQEKSSRTQFVLLSGVRNLIFLLSRLSQSAINVKAYAVEDYCSTLSEIGHMLIEFIVKVKEKHAVEVAKKDLKLIVEIANGLLIGIIKNQPNNSYESFNELSFLYASLIYYSDKNEDGFFLNLYNENVKKMTVIVNTTPQKELDNHGYRILYSYINLFGAWLFHFNPSHKENKSLKRFIRQKKFLSFSLENSNYPNYFVSDDQHIFGVNVWLSQEKDILDALRDQKIYSNFDKFLNIK